jgi:hypothetical protein
MILAATALTLVWGCLQEGPLFYYNSLSNFAIYYSVLLTFALSWAVWIERWISGKPHRRLVLTGKIILFAMVAFAFVQNARRFRGVPPDQAEQARFANSIEEALQLDPVQPKFLNFDWQAGGQTTRVALYLERHGYRWMVRENWPMLFGREKCSEIRVESTGRPRLENSVAGADDATFCGRAPL